MEEYIIWRDKQKKVVRCGKTLYDIKRCIRLLYEHELFEYFLNNRKQQQNG